MGVDCIPRNKKCGTFQTNFWGYLWILSSLRLLGADITEGSSNNDGQRVCAATAREWADILEEGISRLRANREKTMAIGDPTSPCVLDNDPRGLPVDRAMIDQIEEFIVFCRKSSGFKQC